MTNINYVNGALRTEAPITEEMVERFRNKGAIEDLAERMLKVMWNGEHIDKLKKYFFYGKLIELPSVESNYSNDKFNDEEIIRLLHAAMGFSTEVGEIFEALHAYLFQGKVLDKFNLIEEAGDLFWYMAIFADTLSVTFDDIQTRNHQKLQARYPNKFTEVRALTRDLEKERRTLEDFTAGETVFGIKVQIDSWDRKNGYIHGYINGNSTPQTWGIPDGTCLTGACANNLNMESLCHS